MDTQFKKNLIKKFEDKNLAGSTIRYYLTNIEKLNDKEPLNDLNFLDDKEKIIASLKKDKKPNTQRNYLISIVAVLSLDPKKKALYNSYYKDMMAMNKELKSEEAKNLKSETQKENWIEKKEIDDVYEKYKSAVNKFKNDKTLSENKFDILLKFVVLSLYTLTAPRRNKDYTNCYLVKNEKDLDDTLNFVDITNKEFVFNDFKTKKSEGQQIIKIPDDLMSVLNIYVKFHPLINEKDKKFEVPFLVNHEGVPLSNTNSLTLILNRIFQKKIGSTMLRHMYLSNKYGDVLKEQQEDAKNMGHSISMQKDYIKKD